MADLEEPKHFAFGDLNPVAKPRTAKRLDPKNTSVMDAIREVILGHYTSDALEGTGPYKGVVLRVEDDMDQNNPAPGNWLSTVFGPQGLFSFFSKPKTLKRYKVRIPEIHTTLPVPSKFASSPQEVGGHQPIIDMYPTFVAHNSNAEKASAGDLVWVDYGHRTNLEDPTYIGPVFPPPESGAGDTGGSGKDAFGNCGAGGALGGSSGGKIADTRGPVSVSDLPWKNAIYLPPADAKKRNDQPSAGRKVTAGARYYGEKAKIYVEKGGSGRAVSGKVGLGSCSSISDPVDAYCTALRLAVEDQADRGYAFGGKAMDPSIGGVDCSGFVYNVRVITEWLLSSEGTAYQIPDTKDGKKWTRKIFHSSSAYTAGMSEGNWSNIAGSVDDDHYQWAESIGGWQTWRPGDEITYASQTSTPDFAKNRRNQISHVLVVFSDPAGNLRVAESGGPFRGTGSRTAEEYYNGKKGGKAKHWVFQRRECHDMWTGSRARTNPWTPEMLGEEYYSAKSMAAQATGEENPEERKVDGQETPNGNEPTSTATPVKEKTEEAASAEESTSTTPAEASTATPSTSSGCAPKGTTGSPATTTSDGTPAPAAEASGASSSGSEGDQQQACEDALNLALQEVGGDATSLSITREQALSAAISDAERTEVDEQVRNYGDRASIFSTAAGKRYLQQIESIKATYASCPPLPSAGTTTPATTTPESTSTTPAADAPTPSTKADCSSAAKGASPPAAPAAAPSGGCSDTGGSGGGSYTPGAGFTVGADRAGAPLGDVPFVGHLGEIRTDPKMNLVKVPMDKTRSPTGGGHPYYASGAKVREDVAENMFEMKRIMNELGAVMTSSGATRSLSAKVGAGRSATSFHYTSLAFDFTLPAMMSNPNVDEHVIEFDPDDNKQFIFWSRSDKTSGSVEKGGVTFEVEHKTLNAIVAKKGSPPGTEPVTGYWVNVTKLMRAHGMERISGRSSWYRDCSGASEAWHFDLRKNAGLEVGKTTFGQVLETVYTASKISGTPPADSAHRTFRGGSF